MSKQRETERKKSQEKGVKTPDSKTAIANSFVSDSPVQLDIIGMDANLMSPSTMKFYLEQFGVEVESSPRKLQLQAQIVKLQEDLRKERESPSAKKKTEIESESAEKKIEKISSPITKREDNQISDFVEMDAKALTLYTMGFYLEKFGVEIPPNADLKIMRALFEKLQAEEREKRQSPARRQKRNLEDKSIEKKIEKISSEEVSNDEPNQTSLQLDIREMDAIKMGAFTLKFYLEQSGVEIPTNASLKLLRGLFMKLQETNAEKTQSPANQKRKEKDEVEPGKDKRKRQKVNHENNPSPSPNKVKK